MAYPIITDEHINEAMKLEYLIPKVQEIIPKGSFEFRVENDDCLCFLDLLAPVTMFHDAEVDGLYDLYDFKYSNHSSKYQDSRQLHLYKYQFEKLNPGKKIRNMFFVMIPKVNIRQKKTEDLFTFRDRIASELSKSEVQLIPIQYDPDKVIEHWILTKQAMETVDFPKEPGWMCRYCEYEEFCVKGNDFMNLPKNERRNIKQVTKKVIWIYGAPFSGKTFFANQFPDPLMLNTDGNIKFVDAPYIPIKDEVIIKGRMRPERKYAWTIFKETIEELEKKENTFKTVIIDLLEDSYEHCRVYMCGQMGISHESDDSYRAWDKVRSEYLNTIKRVVSMDYENIILISHEDTSKDITKKGGDKITAIKPNLSDRVANKIAGMVDIVARVIADGDVRTLSFKTNEVIFGGGRLVVNEREIPLDINAFNALYEEANKNAVAILDGEKVEGAPASGRRARTKKTDEPAEEALAKEAAQAEAEDAEMKAAQETIEPNTGEVIGQVVSAKPVRTRRKRGE